jgi:hypothetical protein
MATQSGHPDIDSIVLEEKIDPNYVPSEEKVLEYAKWLGMDLENDRDLFWIAREGLMALLPSNWKPCKTKDTEDVYYFNFATGESSWDHPCDGCYKRLYEQEKMKKQEAINDTKNTELDNLSIESNAISDFDLGSPSNRKTDISSEPLCGSDKEEEIIVDFPDVNDDRESTTVADSKVKTIEVNNNRHLDNLSSTMATQSGHKNRDSIVLDEHIDPYYIPSDEEVLEYAKWLGMDLENDRDLFWIAREGLMAPLSSNWKPCKTKDTEDIYYFNFATGESTWDHPCDGCYRLRYQEEKKKQQNTLGDTKNTQLDNLSIESKPLSVRLKKKFR